MRRGSRRTRWIQCDESATHLITAQLKKSGEYNAEGAVVCGISWFDLCTHVSRACRKARGLVWRSRHPITHSNSLSHAGAVAELVGIEGGVVSGVFNLESSGVEASDWRPRHDEQYHEARFFAACSRYGC